MVVKIQQHRVVSYTSLCDVCPFSELHTSQVSREDLLHCRSTWCRVGWQRDAEQPLWRYSGHKEWSSFQETGAHLHQIYPMSALEPLWMRELSIPL